MKRTMLPFLLMLLGLMGCAPVLRAPSLTPTPEPTPTPTPAPVLAVCGGAQDEGFLAMVESIASSAACGFLQLGPEELSAWEPGGRAALILYLDGEAAEAIPKTPDGAVCYAYAADGRAPTEGLLALCYDAADAAAMTLAAIEAYDNHDTPVRLLGLFSAEDSAAAVAWGEAVAAGRVLNKGAYYAGAGEEAAAWLGDRLEGLYPGMIDAILCESAALARDAAAMLSQRERDDIEIFSVSADGALLAAMQESGTPLCRAVGADPAEAGRLCAEQALVLLYGGNAQNLTIRPSVFSAG